MSEDPKATIPVVTAVDRIVLAVRDLDEAEAAYTRLLGRSPSWRRRDKAGGTAHVYYYLDNIGIELTATKGPGVWGQHLDAFLDEHGEGISALSLTSADVELAAHSLNEAGVTTVVMPENEGADGEGNVHLWRHALIARDRMRGMSIFLSQTFKGRHQRVQAPLVAGVAENASITAMDHVVVMTTDAEACKTLFGDKFGIRLALDHTKPEWGVRQLFFRLGGVTIEVVESLDKTKAPKADFLWGTAWKCADINAVRARMVAEGADVSEVRKGRKKGTEIATVRPPTGGVPTLLIAEVAKA
tara:strand:+ start:4236 stop:5135 length:900 start_codon:yes stop_codon:yes gene_type:complete